MHCRQLPPAARRGGFRRRSEKRKCNAMRWRAALPRVGKDASPKRASCDGEKSPLGEARFGKSRVPGTRDGRSSGLWSGGAKPFLRAGDLKTRSPLLSSAVGCARTARSSPGCAVPAADEPHGLRAPQSSAEHRCAVPARCGERGGSLSAVSPPLPPPGLTARPGQQRRGVTLPRAHTAASPLCRALKPTSGPEPACKYLLDFTKPPSCYLLTEQTSLL